MKKYLMIGFVAAVAFSSCSKNDFVTYSPEDVVKAEYDAKFIAEFGKPAANQDWGFGSGTRAFTRATGEFANYVGAYPDANMWTSKGFLAPDPLTPSQKLRAQYYFQMNRITNPNRPDYGTKDFFMQQVYDGGDDPMTGKSPEVYKSVANTDITSGEHMDHLTCGPDHTHTYNFNNGTCSPNPNVANRNQTDVNDTKQQHTDRIQLLLNTKTSCFGYANSDASYVRDDRWTLVSAATIDNFCDNDPNFATWLAAKLPAGETDVKCDDDFHRDFIGFDFDMIPDDETYVWNWENGQKTTPATVKYNWASPQGGNLIYTEDGEFSEFTDWNAEITVKNGKVFRVLDAQTNKYCGTVNGIGGMDGHSEWTETAAYDPNGTNDNSLYLTNIPGHQNDHKALNLKFLAKKYEEGWLPVDSKQLKLWVKVGGCADGYYSDWIVTFMPATSGSTTNYDGRIMAEDLSVSESSDWDFNDIVFDYKIENGVASILLQAAGGTLPLTIGGSLNSDGEVILDASGNPANGIEIHGAAYLGSYMVNTGAGATHAPVPLTLNDKAYSAPEDIVLCVQKTVNGTKQWIVIGAPVGRPAGKFVTDTTTDWVDEYANIKGAYPQFKTWVTNGTGRFQPTQKNDVYFNRVTRDEPALAE